MLSQYENPLDSDNLGYKMYIVRVPSSSNISLVWISGHPRSALCAALSSVGVPHVSANSTVGVMMGSCSRAASENLQ